LQRSLLQVDVAEIIIHEADEPNAVVNFLDAERLTRKNRCDMIMMTRPSNGPRRKLGAHLLASMSCKGGGLAGPRARVVCEINLRPDRQFAEEGAPTLAVFNGTKRQLAMSALLAGVDS
jgi:hypothetical protein